MHIAPFIHKSSIFYANELHKTLNGWRDLGFRKRNWKKVCLEQKSKIKLRSFFHVKTVNSITFIDAPFRPVIVYSN